MTSVHIVRPGPGESHHVGYEARDRHGATQGERKREKGEREESGRGERGEREEEIGRRTREEEEERERRGRERGRSIMYNLSTQTILIKPLQ